MNPQIMQFPLVNVYQLVVEQFLKIETEFHYFFTYIVYRLLHDEGIQHKLWEKMNLRNTTKKPHKNKGHDIRWRNSA